MAHWIDLFDGESLNGWEAVSGGDHDWRAAGGVPLSADDPGMFDIQDGKGILVNGASGRTANLMTDRHFGDCEIHLEFVVPKGSNSGVYVVGQYEIQILDSWGAEDLTYKTCGGIYCRWIDEKPVGGSPPRLNASRRPGEWQSYDVVFRAPRFAESEKRTSPAIFERVVWNDAIVHENVTSEGPTRGAMSETERPRGPLMVQGDHGPVAYRNIRIRELS